MALSIKITFNVQNKNHLKYRFMNLVKKNNINSGTKKTLSTKKGRKSPKESDCYLREMHFFP